MLKCLELIKNNGNLVKKDYYVSKTSGVCYEAGDALALADLGDLSLARAGGRNELLSNGGSADRPRQVKNGPRQHKRGTAALDMSEPLNRTKM